VLCIGGTIEGLLCTKKNALLEIKEQKPDRIIIETSGSAFPAPIAWQIRELSEYFLLDAIITVIDCINFKGYKDTSYTAKLQAQYTDLILLNKHEQISERELDLVIDSVNELNTDTARIKWTTKLEIGLFFGLDSKLFELNNEHLDVSHHSNEVDLIVIESMECQMEIFEKLLEILPKDSVYRVKGLIKPNQILNWAFGRWEWTEYQSQFTINKLTVMGIDLFQYKQQFIKIFGKDGKFEFHKSQRPC
jgi:G3E family GTPase